ncbi:AAA family ATPase [Helicobacter marmotae]|uniref:DNA repair protein RecN n=1 Tax=Helicobacter marmotae TaxID=152490 RepID=A0A3D8I542_9HELI|nr:AAA family ATPase [Helicobacter marmotae]RDU60259.1 DNA recombination protein RecN [Helicobacter marmotae]
MVKRILIHNSPAFKDVELYMQEGFNVFSGASGSGKSVFMESLLAIFGIKESNADLIEANISLDAIHFDWLAEGIPNDDEEEIVLSILKKDKTRYFINHTSSSKKRLHDIVSGFAKHISTKGADELKNANILRILDLFIAKSQSAHLELLQAFQAEFEELSCIKAKLADLESKEANIATLKEFCAFEIAKIESLQPKEGEYEELLGLKKMLSKQEKIKEQLYKVHQILDCTGDLEAFLQLVDKSCPSLFDALSEFEAIVSDQEEQLERVSDINPEEVLDRIAALSELIRRFGSITEALAYLEEQRQKLLEYENLSFDKHSLQKQVSTLSQSCEQKALALHATRLNFVKDLNKHINTFCETLRLQPSSLELQEVPLYAKGVSECSIKLGSSEVNTLSSGEYNRLRLVMMCIEAELSPHSGILVLDEIDANLSGEESEGVAQILKALSRNYQIFAISHQTHMPSLADNHYLVEKVGEHSCIRKLDYDGRVREIARIISGSNITPQALEFAKAHLGKQ